MTNTAAYTLLRSKRRTLSLSIDTQGALIVRAPLHMPQRDIDAFIAQKQQWITSKQALQQKRCSAALTLTGGTLLPLGNSRLTLRFAAVPFGMAYHGFLLLPCASDARESLKSWLLSQAQAFFLPLIAHYEATLGLHPSAIRFSTSRTHWGSMNSKGLLRLNVCLMLCPTAIVDYIIVHELAHMRHMSHSAAFWKLVEEWMPDYRDKRAWLSHNQHLILLLQSDSPADRSE